MVTLQGLLFVVLLVNAFIYENTCIFAQYGNCKVAPVGKGTNCCGYGNHKNCMDCLNYNDLMLCPVIHKLYCNPFFMNTMI